MVDLVGDMIFFVLISLIKSGFSRFGSFGVLSTGSWLFKSGCILLKML